MANFLSATLRIWKISHTIVRSGDPFRKRELVATGVPLEVREPELRVMMEQLRKVPSRLY